MSNERWRRAGLMALGLVVAYVAGQLVALTQGKTVPIAVVLLGLVFASTNALFAVGLVLVYRASRIINFAHAAFGTVATLLFVILFPEFGYFGALLAAMIGAAASAAATEALLIRRFFRAPRLVLTVVTLGAGQLLAAFALVVIAPNLIRFFQGADAAEEGLQALSVTPRSPMSDITFEIFPIRFTGDHILIVIVSLVVLAAMAAFFRFTNVGIAIRGAAENDDRASLLGINTRNLSTLVWIIAALLSAVAAVIVLPTQGFTGAAAAGAAAAVGGGLRTLLKALAAAVLGRMENLPATVVASFGIAIFEQSVFWAFDDTSLVNVALLLVIVVTMLVQRDKLARTDVGIAGTWAATEEIRDIPAELDGHPVVRRGLFWSGAVVAVVVLAFPWVMSPSQTNLGSLYLIFAIVAISLVILTGWGGQISLGQFAFVAVGAAVGGAMTAKAGWPFPVALLIGSVAGAGVAVLLGLPALRIRGLFLAVTTLSFAVMVSTVVLNERYFGWLLPSVVNRPKLLFVDTENEPAYYYLCLAFLLVTIVGTEGIRRSRTGRALIAMRDNERGAQSFGLNLVRVRLSTFAISGFIAAGAGVLFGHHQHAVDPQTFSPDQSIQIFLMAVIGGLGSIRGVLLGAAYLAVVNIIISGAAGQLLAGAVGVLLVLLFFPTGLGGLAYKLRDAWLRRIAIRYRIVVPSLVGDYRVGSGEHARAPLAPKFGPGDERIEIPRRYRLPSRIGTTGTSQAGRGWRF